jgi:glycosyltransferase involved in cell wall biosynthesis
MKVLIAVASFATNMSGLQRHAFNVARSLLLQPEISALHLAIAPWQLNLIEQASLPKDTRLFTRVGNMARNSLSRNLWYYQCLPKLASQLDVDIVHFSYPMPVNAAAFKCPVVVTLHDLYPYDIPENFGFPKVIFNRMVLQQCMRKANSIACVSDATHAALRQQVPESVWRGSVRIYNCVEREPFISAQPPIPDWDEAPFLLCVAQHRRNKNIPLLIEAFHRLRCDGQIKANTKLIVVGIPGPESRKIHRLISATDLKDAIYLLEGLSEADLQWCYSNCEALVAPSSIEGFGLPVAEASLAGCRVICSDIPAHREIGNENCRFIRLEHNAVDALAHAVTMALGTPKPVPRSLPQFSGPVLAKQYLALYETLMGSSRTVDVGQSAAIYGSPHSIKTASQDLALQCERK